MCESRQNQWEVSEVRLVATFWRGRVWRDSQGPGTFCSLMWMPVMGICLLWECLSNYTQYSLCPSLYTCHNSTKITHQSKQYLIMAIHGNSLAHQEMCLMYRFLIFPFIFKVYLLELNVKFYVNLKSANKEESFHIDHCQESSWSSARRRLAFSRLLVLPISTPLVHQKVLEWTGAERLNCQCFSVAWFLVPWCSLLAQHFQKGMTRRLQPVCKRRSIGQYGIFTSSIKQRGPDERKTYCMQMREVRPRDTSCPAAVVDSG